MRKTGLRRIDGVLLLDKPGGVGSNAVLQHVKRLYAAQRAGHTGTLDPMARGLLVVCFGEATKFAAELLEAPKGYRAEVLLGTTTTTGDAEGDELARRPVSLGQGQLKQALARFRGTIRQVPPMYSALKREGRPLYDYARRGETLEREAREVTIHSLELLSLRGAVLELSVSCSKGTYVRTLAEDLGEALGCGAHLGALVRTAVGGFALEEAHSPDALAALDAAARDALLLPVDRLLARYPELRLAPGEAARFAQGQVLELPGCAEGTVRVYGDAGALLGTGCCAGGRLHPRRLLAQEPTRVHAALRTGKAGPYFS